jgi:hypothetical protein
MLGERYERKNLILLAGTIYAAAFLLPLRPPGYVPRPAADQQPVHLDGRERVLRVDPLGGAALRAAAVAAHRALRDEPAVCGA